MNLTTNRAIPPSLVLLVSFLLGACQPASVTPLPLALPTFTPILSVTATLVPTEMITPLPGSTATAENKGWCSPGADIPANFQVIGYLPEYRKLEPAWGNCLTDLIFFSLGPFPDGRLDTSRLKPDLLKSLLEVKERYGTRIHLSLGGFERSDNFAPMATNARTRQAFVKNLTAFCVQNHFDGVDFDWESPSGVAESSSYIALLKETHAALNPLGMLVSVALYPFPDLKVAPYNVADSIYIMSYDRGARHSTFEQAVKDVDFFVAGGIPRDKIILGVPFYGRTIAGRSNSFGYSEIVEKYYPLPETNEVDGIFFNGRNLIQQKTCYARDAGLGGVMIWELGQDSLGSFSLLRALYHGAKDGCADLSP
jgi:chitinase